MRPQHLPPVFPIALRRCVAAAAVVLLAGCEGIQSVHAPAGPDADAIGLLGWIMYSGALAIFLLVMVLTAWAIWARPEHRAWLARPSVVVIGGLIFPVVTLTALLTYGLALAARITEPPPEGALHVEVIGEQFWWRVIYHGRDETADFETANEIRVPTGQPVRISLKSADVIHSFWVPSLAGKMDMIPGRVNEFVLEAERAGIYRGQCAEYCGAQHALMALDVIAEAPEDFAAWAERASGPAARPVASGDLARGREIFMASGCGSCHTIEGTPANGTIGPDLTHVGSRRMLAAGVLPNTRGAMSAWIVRAQEIKPESKMPSFDIFSGPDLEALASYLESLE